MTTKPAARATGARREAVEGDTRVDPRMIEYFATVQDPISYSSPFILRLMITTQPNSFADVSPYSALGAPAPDEPMNKLEPSGSVISRPFARKDRSLAWKPST